MNAEKLPGDVAFDAYVEQNGSTVHLPGGVSHHAFAAGWDARRRWAEAERKSLTDATRERLRALIAEALVNVPVGVSLREEGDLGDYLAAMILAEYRPVVSTRERLAEALDPDAFSTPLDDDDVPVPRGVLITARTVALTTADIVLASGAVEDRAEVERAAIVAYEERRSPSVVIESIAGEPALEWMAKHDAEVEAKMRQAIADEVTRWGAGRHLVEDVVAGIAQSIREGRS